MQKQKRVQYKKQPHARRNALITLSVLVVAGAGGGLYYHRHNQQIAAKRAAARLVASQTPSIPTHTATSEGSTFQVPDTVPKDAVKDYKLLIDNSEFKIRENPDGGYTITLYAIVNNPSEYNDYTAELKQYKQDALTYMKQQNIETTKVAITYDPPEATQL